MWKTGVLIKSILLVYEAIRTTVKRPNGVVGVCGTGHLGVIFLRGSMCAEGMSWGVGWVIWGLRGLGTASGRPGVS